MKHLVLLVAVLSPLTAYGAQLILRDSQDRQVVRKVLQSGEARDPSRVLWDTRQHGPIPAPVAGCLGGLSGQAPSLACDQAAADAQAAAIAAEAQSELDEAAALAALKSELRTCRQTWASLDASAKQECFRRAVFLIGR